MADSETAVDEVEVEVMDEVEKEPEEGDNTMIMVIGGVCAFLAIGIIVVGIILGVLSMGGGEKCIPDPAHKDKCAAIADDTKCAADSPCGTIKADSGEVCCKKEEPAAAAAAPAAPDAAGQ